MPEFYIKTLSPIHIGCDEVYEPMEFYVDENREELVTFRLEDFLVNAESRIREKFSAICKKGTVGSIMEMFRFMAREVPLAAPESTKISVTTGFVELYGNNLKLNEREFSKTLNQLKIERTAFNRCQSLPFIPGSSIKGSLRTAYLNFKQHEKNLPKKDAKQNKELERNLLDGGSFHTDPFSLLKVSDFHPIGRVKTRIVFAVNQKKKLSDKSAVGPYQILEVIEPESCFHGSIKVLEPNKGRTIKTPLSMDRLLDSTKRFYFKEKARENMDCVRVGIPAAEFGDTESVLLRLGRHSGAECVTIEHHRHIRIKLGRSDYTHKTGATTLWLSSEYSKPIHKNNLHPFGWASLAGLSPELRRELEESAKLAVNEEPKAPTKAKDAPPKPVPVVELETWEKAYLSWLAGQGILRAELQGKRAETKDKSVLPESLSQKVLVKRKPAFGRVTVKKLGVNHYEIVKIESV